MAVTASRAARIQDVFSGFRSEIDEYNDRRERLIKASRDVTTASKRLIFHLHRFPHASFGTALQATGAAVKVLSEAEVKRTELVAMIVDFARREALDQDMSRGHDDAIEPGRAIRHDRAIGPGLEEFIEAISFLHFLRHGTIITLAEVQAFFMDGDQVILPITPQRYLLGLSDLSGEMMRFATNALGTGEAEDVVATVLSVLRELTSALDPFVPLIRDFRKKQQVTMQSTRKIEDLSYAVKVRSSEYGSNPQALREMVRRALAGGSGEGQAYAGETEEEGQ